MGANASTIASSGSGSDRGSMSAVAVAATAALTTATVTATVTDPVPPPLSPSVVTKDIVQVGSDTIAPAELNGLSPPAVMAETELPMLSTDPRIYVRVPPPTQHLPSCCCAICSNDTNETDPNGSSSSGSSSGSTAITVKDLIDLVAGYVSTDGETLEAALRVRESANPDFDFLLPAHPSMLHKLITNSDENPVTNVCALAGTSLALDLAHLQLYYRWAVYARLMGDMDGHRLLTWRVSPFQLTVGGIFLIPPCVPLLSEQELLIENEQRELSEYESRRRRSRAEVEAEVLLDKERFAGVTGTQMEKMKREELRISQLKLLNTNNSGSGCGSEDEDCSVMYKRKKQKQCLNSMVSISNSDDHGAATSIVFGLTRNDYLELTAMLKQLPLSRVAIANCLAWCLDHMKPLEQYRQQTISNLVQDIGDVLRQSLLEYMTPWSVKLARLCVCHDILMNTAANIHHITKFRSYFQDIFPIVFEHIGFCYRKGVRGRITARNVRRL